MTSFQEYLVYTLSLSTLILLVPGSSWSCQESWRPKILVWLKIWLSLGRPLVSKLIRIVSDPLQLEPSTVYTTVTTVQSHLCSKWETGLTLYVLTNQHWKNAVLSLSCDISNLPFSGYKMEKISLTFSIMWFLQVSSPYQAHSAHPNRNLFNFPQGDFSSDLAKALSAAGAHTYKYKDV